MSRVLVSDVAPASDDEESEADQKYSITVEKNQALYTLLFDNIGGVRALPDKRLDNFPSNLNPQFHKVASGIYVYGLKGELLVVLDVDKVYEL